jgi:hypothetical protein
LAAEYIYIYIFFFNKTPKSALTPFYKVKGVIFGPPLNPMSTSGVVKSKSAAHVEVAYPNSANWDDPPSIPRNALHKNTDR